MRSRSRQTSRATRAAETRAGNRGDRSHRSQFPGRQIQPDGSRQTDRGPVFRSGHALTGRTGFWRACLWRALARRGSSVRTPIFSSPLPGRDGARAERPIRPGRGQGQAQACPRIASSVGEPVSHLVGECSSPSDRGRPGARPSGARASGCAAGRVRGSSDRRIGASEGEIAGPARASAPIPPARRRPDRARNNRVFRETFHDKRRKPGGCRF